MGDQRGRMMGQQRNKSYSLPFVPSDLIASHHFPDLSTTSRTSPLLNVSSYGSAGDALSGSIKIKKGQGEGINLGDQA